MKNLSILLAFVVCGSVFAGHATYCDDADSVAKEVVAKAKKKFANSVFKNASFSTDSGNVSDDDKKGGEVWTVYAVLPTGKASLKLHVNVDDGACKVQ